MHFSDPFNLIKMNRYKKVSIEKFLIPSDIIDIIRDTLSLQCIVFLPDALDNNKERKIENDQPKNYSISKKINKSIEIGEVYLLISIDKIELICKSIYNEEVSV